jgi:hypothetical protein
VQLPQPATSSAFALRGHLLLPPRASGVSIQTFEWQSLLLASEFRCDTMLSLWRWWCEAKILQWRQARVRVAALHAPGVRAATQDEFEISNFPNFYSVQATAFRFALKQCVVVAGVVVGWSEFGAECGAKHHREPCPCS